jgi:hypothetical protein
MGMKKALLNDKFSPELSFPIDAGSYFHDQLSLAQVVTEKSTMSTALALRGFYINIYPQSLIISIPDLLLAYEQTLLYITTLSNSCLIMVLIRINNENIC